MMSAANPIILFVDDDKNFRQVTSYVLKEFGYQVIEAANGHEGVEALERAQPDIILCDLKMPAMDGMAFLAELRRRGISIPVVVITAFGTIENAVEAMRAGASDYVTKPVMRDALRMALERTLEHQQLKTENRLLRERVSGKRSAERLIGDSSAMRELRQTLQRLAESTAPVLLRGESGVGKELAARALHFDGPRALSGHFVVLNCAAIPGELLESELFGHRKGSFTGAQRDAVGKFETADQGTLFLDEIGDMPLALQAKLLRALQEGEVTPIGESLPRRVDVRVVAATNQPLEERVARGEFRQDLYYRLAVVPVEIPPLRVRLEDLSMLLRHFLQSYGAGNAQVSSEAHEALLLHSWPGNVRELENAVQRACALHPGLERLELSDLPPTVTKAPSAQLSAALWSDDTLRLPEEGVHYEEIERKLLLSAWLQSGRNQKRGAQLLGLARQAFIYRLQKHGILPPYSERDNRGE